LSYLALNQATECVITRCSQHVVDM